MKKQLPIQSLLAAMLILVAACSGEKTKTDTDTKKAAKDALVTVDMYIMSKCPYGVQALDGIIPALETFKGEVGLSVNYIGMKDPSGKLTSMHGQEEVDGNIAQLCAKEVAPDKYLAFLTCVNKEWKTIPANTESCAKQTKIDEAALKKCTDGDQGKKLLEASFEKAQSVGAQGSPTIKVKGEDYQGGRTPKDFEKSICNSHGKAAGIAYCKDLPPPPEVRVTAITDKRCGEKCDPTNVIKSLQSVFPGLKPTILEWSEGDTKAICAAAGIKMLPAVFFDESIEKDTAGMAHMEKWLEKAGKYRVLKVQPIFDPTAEICTNKIDDTSNGLVDCDDPTCKSSMDCREETPKSLEVFVMSQCPYGAMAIKAMKGVLEAFGNDMNFIVHYIAEQDGENITSMHGPAEVEENIRMLCAAKHYPKNNKYLEYLLCRAEDYRNPAWQSCAKDGINPNVIEKCTTGGEGKALLAEDIKIGKALGISGSPTWVVNGRTKFSGVAPPAIQKNFCGKNEDLKGCSAELAGPSPAAAPQGSCGN